MGVTAVDDHTLTYTLTYDFPGFLSCSLSALQPGFLIQGYRMISGTGEQGDGFFLTSGSFIPFGQFQISFGRSSLRIWEANEASCSGV